MLLLVFNTYYASTEMTLKPIMLQDLSKQFPLIYWIVYVHKNVILNHWRCLNSIHSRQLLEIFSFLFSLICFTFCGLLHLSEKFESNTKKYNMGSNFGITYPSPKVGKCLYGKVILTVKIKLQCKTKTLWKKIIFSVCQTLKTLINLLHQITMPFWPMTSWQWRHG